MVGGRWYGGGVNALGLRGRYQVVEKNGNDEMMYLFWAGVTVYKVDFTGEAVWSLGVEVLLFTKRWRDIRVWGKIQVG